MLELQHAEESEVVLEFLRAEIDSPRWSNHYPAALAEHGLNRTDLIDHADLRDKTANGVRRDLLGRFRGFGLNRLIFAGFPDDIRWRWVRLSEPELRILKYANLPGWIELSGGTRLVTDGAKNLASMGAETIGSETKSIIESIAQGVRDSHEFPALIAAESNEGFLVLVEGHCRATGYVTAGLSGNVDLLVGSSPRIPEWKFY